MSRKKRVVYPGVSWGRYLKLDELRGQDSPNPRLYFLDGELEIMTRSSEHERIKKWIGEFVGDYLFEVGDQSVWTRGEATMLSTLEEASAEPDDSWCIGEEREFPNLVLEVALTSGGIRNTGNLPTVCGVGSLVLAERERLEIFILRADGTNYDKAETGSRLLTKLDVALLERCVGIINWLEARRTFRAGLAAGK